VFKCFCGSKDSDLIYQTAFKSCKNCGAIFLKDAKGTIEIEQLKEEIEKLKKRIRIKKVKRAKRKL